MQVKKTGYEEKTDSRHNVENQLKRWEYDNITAKSKK